MVSEQAILVCVWFKLPQKERLSLIFFVFVFCSLQFPFFDLFPHQAASLRFNRNMNKVQSTKWMEMIIRWDPNKIISFFAFPKFQEEKKTKCTTLREQAVCKCMHLQLGIYICNCTILFELVHVFKAQHDKCNQNERLS